MAQTPKDEHDNQQDQPQEPWNAQFDDDLDDEGNYSRVKKRRRHHGNSILTWSIVIGLVVVLLVPIIWLAVDKRMQNSASDQEQTSIAVSSSSKVQRSTSASRARAESKASAASARSAAKRSSAKEARAKRSSSKPTSSSTAASASSSVTTSTSSESVSSSSSSASAGGSYTVQPGDNLYRIAVNHGMTLAQIQALNGMGTSTSVTPGQTLKVN